MLLKRTNGFLWMVLLNALLVAGPIVAVAEDPPPSADVEAMQQRLLSDDQYSGVLHELASDPAVRDILADPEIQRALQDGDTAALLQNPKLQDLAGDPRVQGLSKDLAK